VRECQESLGVHVDERAPTPPYIAEGAVPTSPIIMWVEAPLTSTHYVGGGSTHIHSSAI
jgi:hypothetical protein